MDVQFPLYPPRFWARCPRRCEKLSVHDVSLPGHRGCEDVVLLSWAFSREKSGISRMAGRQECGKVEVRSWPG